MPTITDINLAIIGPTGSPGITISGGGKVQLINQSPEGAPYGTLNLQYLTLTNGYGWLSGAIDTDGALNIANCTFSGSSGGIYGEFSAVVTITNSTFSDIFISNTGYALTITNSTFSGHGSGISAVNGVVIATNSTFSGIGNAFNDFNPFMGNGFGGTFKLKGNILAHNSAGNCSFDGSESFIDAGYNISDDGTCGFTASTSKNNTNPMLAAGLANNGGPTETIALLAGSPAINSIPIASCTYPAGSLNPCSNASSVQLTCDQRHYLRPAPGDTACSIGAYEFDAVPPPTPTPTPPPCPPGEGWTENASGFQCIAIPKCPAACFSGCIIVPPGVPPNNKPGASTPIYACKNAQGGIGTINRQ